MLAPVASEQEAFRNEVKSFLQEHWLNAADRDPTAFRQKAVDAGYVYRAFPKEYGGSGQEPDPVKAHIIREEFDKVRAPREVSGNGPGLLVPTLLACGEAWQKERFVAKTLSGEYVWCQGYSEPGAGSDLANIRTTAVLEGDEWVINGQKVWTSNAHNSQYMFILVRTEPDAPKHQGISYLLLDMRQPGVTVRPLKQITGESHFNEIFLDNARTPKDWIVGKRGEGWTVSRTTLVHERNTVGASMGSDQLFNQLLKLARTTDLNGKPAIQDPLIRDELGRIYARVSAHRAAGQHQLNLAAAGRESGPSTGAFTKLYGSAISESIGLLAQRIIADSALAEPTENRPGPGRWVTQYLNSIAAQIGGGTSNMQRNQIAERARGPPRGYA
jgi:alkylation response protein AidB-like acyl-CoA dehydrogenase